MREFKEMVKAFHAAGLEVILDVVYNHTSEGNHLGPHLNFKGFDNPAYYHLVAEDRRYYMDYTGTGNSVNLRHPYVLQLVMDSLRYWVTEMHVDGFRFDLAATLARGAHTLDTWSAFFATIHQDPVLQGVKLIAEPWDTGTNGYQVGNFPYHWSEWNDRYRESVRGFWRNEPGRLPEVAARLTGSIDLFKGSGRRPSASINYIASHDGLTLNDLAGGDTRLKRNLLATVLLSMGTPMLGAGDEWGRSQQGNDNAYNQDNEISWLDWSKVEPDLQALVASPDPDPPQPAVDPEGPVGRLRPRHPLAAAGWRRADHRGLGAAAGARGDVRLARGRQGAPPPQRHPRDARVQAAAARERRLATHRGYRPGGRHPLRQARRDLQAAAELGRRDRQRAGAGVLMAARVYPVGAELVSATEAHVRVWAPDHASVTLVIDGRTVALDAEPGGYHACQVVARPGSRYGFRFDGDEKVYPDPASRSQPDGPDGLSAIVDLARARVAGRRVAGRLAARTGALRAAHRHLHARGHLARGGGAPGPPARRRRHGDPDDAGGGVRRQLRLGLRRRAVVRAVPRLRRRRRISSTSSTPRTGSAWP